ncbi:CCHC-type domain-containing protein [Pycnococcus provasolii]
MENNPQAFPRYPDLPSRISDNMESKDIIRLQRDLTTNALNLMGEGDKKRYDGLSDGYRRWEKAIVNTFNSIGLNHLERFFKHKNVKQIGKTNRALWRNAFCQSDRRLIHNVVLGTITAEAALAADDDSQNGILLIAYFYEQWGSPSLPNTITALRELLNTKVEYNDNPAPAFKNVERIMRDFFPESGDNIKIALVFMVLNEAKYRPVLDVYQEIRTAADQRIPTYDELKEKVLSFFRRKLSLKGNGQPADNKGREKRKRQDEVPDAKAFNTNPGYENKGNRGGKEQGDISRKRRKFCNNCKTWTCKYGTANCPVGKDGKNGNGKGKHQHQQNYKKKFCGDCGSKLPKHHPHCQSHKNSNDHIEKKNGKVHFDDDDD